QRGARFSQGSRRKLEFEIKDTISRTDVYRLAGILVWLRKLGVPHQHRNALCGMNSLWPTFTGGSEHAF
ncbi:MAG: hypothetical protein DMG71_02260, partial [Acidobacteria bacterium]